MTHPVRFDGSNHQFRSRETRFASFFRKGARLRNVIALALPLAVALTMGGCPMPPDGNGTVGDTIREDTTAASLTVEVGETLTFENNAVLTVTGDAVLNGTIRAATGRLEMRIGGALTINGLLTNLDEGTAQAAEDAPLSEQTVGIFLRVGDGAVAINDGAVLESSGPIVITDDDSTFARSPRELFDEVEDVSGDNLPTLVPLPPDNPAFDGDPEELKAAIPTVLQGGLPPVTLSGTWPPAGAPPPPGDAPVVIFRFMGNRPLDMNNYTINGPAAPAGRSADQSMNAGDNASGGRGKNGMRLNITNNGGPINIVNTVTLNLTDGGPGGEATAACATATGGPGGNSGNFRMTAAGGIDIRNGMLIINPGRSGDGGNATVDAGPAGAAGCPGETGRNSTATGGRGGDNRKRLLARGSVQGLENVTIGAVRAGNGGNAMATACNGGNGLACCTGGAGGNATSTGGAGGNASVSVRGLPVATSGAFGGDGGRATSTGGNGGNGGDCKFDDAGDGGAGGMASANGGGGGSGIAPNAGGVGGDGGTADATGGDGGNGGSSGLGNPGSGGAGGGATTTAGGGGAGDTAGEAGVEVEAQGVDGTDGGALAITLYCIDLAFLATDAGPIAPGRQTGPVRDFETMQEIGAIDVELVGTPDGNYQRGDTPVPHIGIGPGIMIVDVQSLQLLEGTPGAVGGVRIVPLFANGITEQNPLIVEALDGNGGVLAAAPVAQLPNNFASTGNLAFVDVTFENIEIPAAFRFLFPTGSFVTCIRIYLIDP